MAASEREVGRRSGRPGLVIGALVALALIIGGIAWALLQEPPPLQVRRLPDGTELRLEAVSVGKEHRFVSGPRWKRLLAPLLAPGARDRLLGMVPTLSGPDQLIFRTEWQPAQRSPFSGTLFDEHGCWFHADHYRDPLVNGRQLTTWAARVWPRRAARVGLRLNASGRVGRSPAADFRVPNPAPGPYPVWKADALPITRKQGNTTFTLTALTTGAEGPGPQLRPASAGKPRWSRASFRIRQGGQPTEAWWVVGLTLSDATGNVVEPRATSRYAQEGMVHFALEGGLCVAEPAWKLRAEFARQQGFEPEDLWVVRDVPITRQGRLVDSPTGFTRHGVTLRLLGIAATGTQAPPGGASMGDRPAVYVQAPGPLEGMRLWLVRATDDQGRVVTSTGTGLSGTGLHSFDLQAAPDVRSLDLTFALQRSRFVEFVAKPSALPVKAER